MSAKQVQKIKDLIANKDGRGAFQELRDLRYKLEAFAARINNQTSKEK